MTETTPRPLDPEARTAGFSDALHARANDAVLVIDRRGIVVHATPPTERVLGRTPGFLRGQPIELVLADEDRFRFRAAVLDAANGHLVDDRFKMLHADGSTRIVSITITDADDETGLDGVIIEIGDVTVSVADYETLRDSERRYRELSGLADQLAASSTTTAVLNATARQLARSIGDACAIMLVESETNRLVTVAWHHPNPDADSRLGAVLVANPTPLDSPFYFAQVARNGKTMLINEGDHAAFLSNVNPAYRPMLSKFNLRSMLVVPLVVDSEVIGVLGLAREHAGSSYSERDVSLADDLAGRAALAIFRSRADEHVVTSEEHLRDAFEHSAIGMAIEDFDGTVVRVNPAYARIVGRSREHLEGHSFVELTHPEDRQIDAETIRVLRDGPISARVVEKRIVRPDGRIAWVRAHVSARFDDLGRRIGISAQIEDITNWVEAQTRLDHATSHDPVTGLANRLNLLESLAVNLSLVDGVGVIHLGLDRFRRVNDSLGHRAGDAILGALADRLMGATPADAVVARIAGDEFVIIHPGLHTIEATFGFANDLRALVSVPVELGDRAHITTASIGVTTALPGDDPEDVLRSATIAMHLAKEHGRDRCERYDDSLRETAVERLGTEDLIRDALRNGWFRLYYQPVVDLATGKLAGAEALLRLAHPERGVLPPGLFLDAAEETGLITPIGTWAIREACHELARWNRTIGPGLRMAVNVSGQQLQFNDLGSLVTNAIDEAGVDPDQLILEMTESILVDSSAEAFADLRSLRAIGVHLALDDFGTGYSSLAYLKRFPVDKIKIDRSFVNGLDVSADDTAIVEAIISLGTTLHLDVVAEGIETVQQAARLKGLNCGYGQGYHFDKPLPADEFIAHATDPAHKIIIDLPAETTDADADTHA